MNKERIKQCKKDINVLQKELVVLEETDEMFTVYNVRVVGIKGGHYRIGVGDFGGCVLDEDSEDLPDCTSTMFNRREVKELIEKLQNLLGESK